MAQHRTRTATFLVAAIACVAAAVPATAANVTPVSPTGLPLIQFSQASASTPEWTASSLSAADNGASMLYAPHTAQSGSLDVVAFTTANHTVAVLARSGTATTYTNLSTREPLPLAEDAPIPFFDARGDLNLVYIDDGGDVILLTNDPDPATSALGRAAQFAAQPWVESNLSLSASLVGTATGEPAATIEGDTDLIALRTTTEQLDVLSVTDARPYAVTATTAVAPTIGVTTDPAFLGTPLDGVATLAATSAIGALDVFTQGGDGTWTTNDLSLTIKSPTISGPVAGAGTATDLYVVGSSMGSGDAELDTYDEATGTWVNTNLTRKTATLVPPGPAVTDQLTVTPTGSGVTVAGAAAGWGDLFAFTDTSGSWVTVDVSASGGELAKTVGGGVAALDPGGTVTFFAGGVATPAAPGVGIYDIPSADLPHAVSDGWPILADTGGLGTEGAPYVHVPTGATTAALQNAIRYSEDFSTGLAIQLSHKRDTWLSFWTVSGPNQLQTADPSTYRANAYAAGAAVATTIDQYAADGLSLKPDWVILDPEGYPDNHSQLNGYDVSHVHGTGTQVVVTTTSPTDLATGDQVTLAETGVAGLTQAGVTITVTSPTTFHFAATTKATANSGIVLEDHDIVANWRATMAGWAAGLASVDPSLHAGIYTDESEYLEGDLATSSMPVFLAIAWGTGASAPVPITHSSNVLGFIEFGNVCKSGEVQRQLDMFDAPPWNGRYDTVQFNPPGYCTPHTP